MHRRHQLRKLTVLSAFFGAVVTGGTSSGGAESDEELVPPSGVPSSRSLVHAEHALGAHPGAAGDRAT
ncbi:MAG: hypothetical protein U0174_05960 [Polyangiaceae bacterium]